MPSASIDNNEEVFFKAHHVMLHHIDTAAVVEPGNYNGRNEVVMMPMHDVHDYRSCMWL